MTVRRIILIALACIALGVGSAAAQDDTPLHILVTPLNNVDAATGEAFGQALIGALGQIQSILQSDLDIALSFAPSSAIVRSHETALALAQQEEAAFVVWSEVDESDTIVLHITLNSGMTIAFGDPSTRLWRYRLAPLTTINVTVNGDDESGAPFVILSGMILFLYGDFQETWELFTVVDGFYGDDARPPGDNAQAVIDFYLATSIVAQGMQQGYADGFRQFPDIALSEAQWALDDMVPRFPRADDPLANSAVLSNRALADSLRGEYSGERLRELSVEPALNTLDSVVDTLPAEVNPYERARLLFNLAFVRVQIAPDRSGTTQLDRAEADLLEAAALLPAADYPFEYGMIHYHLATVYTERHKLSESLLDLVAAERAYEQALLGWTEQGESVGYNLILDLLRDPLFAPLRTAQRGPARTGGQRGTVPLGGQEVWTFTVQAGDRLTISVMADDAAALDTVLRVVASDDALIAENDDIAFPDNTHSGLVDLTFTEDDTIRLIVTSYEGASSGRYTLVIAAR